MVDQAIGKVPRGDGNGVVTDEEVGPGGWRFNGRGKSFVTYRYTLGSSGYAAVVGQSNFIGNRGVVNDYPRVLDIWAPPRSEPMVFRKGKGELVLYGDRAADPPRFALPGSDGGQVRIPLHDPDGDGVFVGCASSPYLKNFGTLVTEGGDFLQHNLYKAYAVAGADGVVTMFEWTEAVVFKNVEPDQN
jgi:hypothetical protein